MGAPWPQFRTQEDTQFNHLCDATVLMLAQLDASFTEVLHWKDVLLQNMLPPNVSVRLVTSLGWSSFFSFLFPLSLSFFFSFSFSFSFPFIVFYCVV
jgi:hypothetical protein